MGLHQCSYQRKLCPVYFVGWKIAKIGVMAFVSQSLRVYCGGWKAFTAYDVSEARLINIDTGHWTGKQGDPYFILSQKVETEISKCLTIPETALSARTYQEISRVEELLPTNLSKIWRHPQNPKTFK